MSNDLIDDLLSLGSTPDWISPLAALTLDFINGPSQHLYIDRQCGYSVNQIKRLLKLYGVRVWGDMIADGMIIVTVRKRQARWANYILRRAGVGVIK